MYRKKESEPNLIDGPLEAVFISKQVKESDFTYLDK